MTKKEKIITEIIYNEYKKSGSRYLTHSDLGVRSNGQLTGPELAQMFNHGQSKYFKSKGGYNTEIEITFEGIEYMEGKLKRNLQAWGFWLFGVASMVAAFYAVLFYYFK